MNNQAALLTEHSAKENRLYLAIELSRKKWKLALSDGKGGTGADTGNRGAGFSAIGWRDRGGEETFWAGSGIADGQLL